MNENFSGPFIIYLNSEDIEENATSQNSLDCLNIQFSVPTQYPHNFLNVPYIPQCQPNFKISQNLPTYPNNAPKLHCTCVCLYIRGYG